MRIILIVSLIVIFSGDCLVLYSQNDNDPPLTPTLKFISVQPETGRTEIEWERCMSPDAAGYVLYYYRNGEGFAFDTVKNPLTTSYINFGSSAQIRSESYVVAAYDTAGNISPLSNDLSTVYTIAEIDTCNNRITLGWTRYKSYPVTLEGYSVMISENGGPLTEAGTTPADVTSFNLENFHTGMQLCFVISANLSGGLASNSQKSCLSTKMQRPPSWINADYATVGPDGKINMSFTIDPGSEINSFWIQRMNVSDNEYITIASRSSEGDRVIYTDPTAENTSRYLYRIAAVNNCGNPVIFSNTASNMLLTLSVDDDMINLAWNSYKAWNGGVSGYTLQVNTGDGYTEKTLLSPNDTAIRIAYSELMYSITDMEVCFRIAADENPNEFGITGRSLSNQACSDIIERVTVPNAFTPGNDNINDFFAPVLSFIPAGYHLLITDRKNSIVFETNDHTLKWDGTKNGVTMPEGVYLWFLKTESPSGRIISRTGTVAVIRKAP